ncbi:MAG: hypothetical protein BMS9Abin26_0736 [Gammaproteobacteria bacterium]|nr:MAG: hypothetical protein BMS9Abin26_0736 [Gammaproteobacteria bacterium]
MSYQVLARKWRPKFFTELVGQEHVRRALVNALDSDRLHHAYLFSGTRGVGKTTVARIFAKSLNCEQGVSATPCGQCSACIEIDEGRFVDLIEVDAASRTKVESTRELLDNVQYAPTRARYKVYLIDEVHMFSNHSFNALLKTLEEPPPHVKFLLATTDPQKLPVTILSRCLQFNLKRLYPDAITKQLSMILDNESVEHDAGAISRLAISADGSMRDALSLLDQAIAFGGGSVREDDVRKMLGSIDSNHVFDILDGVVSRNGAQALASIRQMDEQAPDYAGVLAEMVSILQKTATAQVAPEMLDGTDGYADERAEAIKKLSMAMSPLDVQLCYQIALNGRRDIAISADPRSSFEMIILRMLAFSPADTAPVATMTAPTAKPLQSTPASKPAATNKTTPDKEKSKQASSNAQVSASSAWGDIIEVLKLGGLEKELASNTALEEEKAGGVIRLSLDPACANLLNDTLKERLNIKLNDYFKQAITLTIDVKAPTKETPAKIRERLNDERQREAISVMKEDETVKAICDVFDTDIESATIHPVDN